MHPPHTSLSILGIPCTVNIFYNLVHPLPVCGRKSNCSLNLGVSELNRARFNVNEQFDVFLLAHDRVRAPAEERAALRSYKVELLQWEIGLEECILCTFWYEESTRFFGRNKHLAKEIQWETEVSP